MTVHRYSKLSEVVIELRVKAEFLETMEAEGLIHLKRSSEGEPIVSSEDVERIRVAQELMAQLDVNLPGVEVVMHMRDSMLALQRQFSEILDTLVDELRRRLQQ